MSVYRSAVRLVRSLRLERPIHALAGSLIGVETIRPVFHLTYDDGPHPEVTPRVLDVLDEFSAKATFFVLTANAERHPELIEEELRRGHEVALHTRSHPRLTECSWRRLGQEIHDAADQLRDIAGRDVRWFRPPYGAQNVRSLMMVRNSGMRTVLWSVDSRDWKGLTPEQPLERSNSALRGGGILLMHDTPVDEEVGDDASRGFIPKDQLTRLYLEALRERQLDPVSLDELLRMGHPRRKAKLG